MDNVGSDRFALEPFGLAFAIQRTVQSRRILSEAKEQLLHDLTKLKEQGELLAKTGENQERIGKDLAEKQRERT
jgi:hypothetical protein